MPLGGPPAVIGVPSTRWLLCLGFGLIARERALRPLLNIEAQTRNSCNVSEIKSDSSFFHVLARFMLRADFLPVAVAA